VAKCRAAILNEEIRRKGLHFSDLLMDRRLSIVDKKSFMKQIQTRKPK
jgi:hypothetical protein